MFEVIKTGSSGNCFKFKSIIIDIGIPYSLIKNHLKDISHIFISHEHGDHLNITTVRKILTYHEDIIFICGKWVRDIIKIVDDDRVKVIYPNEIYEFGDIKISPIILFHDTQCFGLRILTKQGYKHIHATDTNTLDGITALNYDSASIECNHEINKTLELIKESEENGEFSHLRGAINSHLSVDKVIKFCKENNIKKLYPIHIGNSTKKEVIEKLKEW